MMRALVVLALLAAPLQAQTPDSTRTDSTAVWAKTIRQYFTTKGDTVRLTKTDSLYCSAASCPPGVWSKTPPTPPPPPPPPPDTTTPPPVNRVGAYASPSGSGSSCTMAAPCSLATGVTKTGAGDTLWLRQGLYAGQQINLARSKICLRAYPGDRVQLDGSLLAYANGGCVWGMEIFSSKPVTTSFFGITAKGVGVKLINNVIHDVGMSCIGFWHDTQGGEAYGNIVYNCGTHDNLDHGIYFNNTTGTMRLRENVVFHTWAYGLHGYSSTPGELTGLSLDGNTTFNAGLGLSAPDLMIGGVAVPSVSVTNHSGWKTDGYTDVDLGYIGGSAKNGSVTVSGTFVGTPGLMLNRWTTITRTGAVDYSFAGKPTSGAKVMVRPNAYEAGRATVTIYNWGNAASIPVDLSGVLTVGKPFQVHNVCGLWRAPLASGLYTGAPVSISMEIVPAPVLIGRTWKRRPADCGVLFGVFLVESK